jgi:hypothetical protein
MTDRTRFEQMLEHLINGEQSKAEEVFHDLVVAKSREIYENLLDDDFQVDETSEDDVEEDVEENFDLEAVGGDPADAMIDAVTGDDEMDGGMDGGMDGEMSMDDEEGDAPATKDDVMDIKDALDELRAEFEAKMGGNSDDMDSMDDEEGAEDDGEESEEEPEDEEGDDEENPFAKESMREYVEKVAPAKMGDNGVSNKSTVAGKNPLGNSANAGNIAKGGESNKGGTQGGLANPATKDLNTGNVNVPGSKTATKMHPTKGHGAEKKGSGDNGVNTRSIVGK